MRVALRNSNQSLYDNLDDFQDGNIKNETKEEVKVNALKNNQGIKGVMLALFAALVSGSLVVMIKKINLLTGAENVVIRYIMQVIIHSMIGCYLKINLLGERQQRKLLCLRGVFGFFGVISAYIGIWLIDPSDGSAIVQSYVVMTAILSRFFLNEKLTITHFLSLILSIFGIFLICQPSFILTRLPFLNHTVFHSNISRNDFENNKFLAQHHYVLGASSSFLCAFSVSFVNILLRKLAVKKAHYAVVTLYTSVMGLPIALLLSYILMYTGASNLVYNYNHKFNELIWHILFSVIAGIISALNQIISNLSFKYIEASKISLIRASDLFFVYLFQYIFLNVESKILTTIGAVLILSSTLFILIFEILDEKHSKNLDKHKQSSPKEPKILSCFEKLFFYRF